jgi:hypothetical protein
VALCRPGTTSPCWSLNTSRPNQILDVDLDNPRADAPGLASLRSLRDCGQPQGVSAEVAGIVFTVLKPGLSVLIDA